MGKKKKVMLAKMGRPKGITKMYGSKDFTKCPVPGCGKTARNDKIMDHQIELVLFNSDGQAASEDNPRFKNLSEVEKAHTLYFNSVGATNSKFPENIFIRSSKKVLKMVAPGQSTMDKFIKTSGPGLGAMEVDNPKTKPSGDDVEACSSTPSIDSSFVRRST